MPQREEQDYSEDLASPVANEIPALSEMQLEQLGFCFTADEHEGPVAAELQSLRKELYELKRLQTRTQSSSRSDDRLDPDDARRIVQERQIDQWKIEQNRKPNERQPGITLTKFVAQVEAVEAITGELGSNLEKQQFSLLKKQLERSAERGDGRSVDRVLEEMNGLRWRILAKFDWFWQDLFDATSRDPTSYIDPAEPLSYLNLAPPLSSGANGEELKKVVRGIIRFDAK